ncbi:MAG: hypothetical protein IKR48_03480, partial [Kiritimatiellae bacterium]|nr:hypothetical protein [Kiritimatiellia bacterium]
MKTFSAFIRSVVLTVAFCVASLAMSYAADRTISANYTLNADETVDGILTIADGVTVDLNGYNLTVKGLAGGGTIGAGAIDFTSPDPNEERVSYTTGSGDFYGGTKAINLFNDNYERQADDSHRVIIETKNLPLIVTYDFGSGSPRTIDMYRVFCGFYGNNTVNRRSPKSWTFEGSNDNENWATLDSRNSETNWSKEQETRTYTFTNTTAYRYYRITFTAANSTNNDYMELVQLEYLNSADCLSVPSELHVNVPANTFETNSTVTICGDVRLVKEGAGEFVVTKANQPYSGGNEVAAGTLKAEPRIIQLFG